MALTNQQRTLIEAKAKSVRRVFDHLQLSTTPSDNTVKLLTIIDTPAEPQQINSEQINDYQLERRKHYHILRIESYGKSRKNQSYIVTVIGGKIVCDSVGNVYYLRKNGYRQRFSNERLDSDGEQIITTGGRGLHGRTYAVMDLVAMCFCPWYNERVNIYHINGNKSDNRPDNLRPDEEI